MTYAEAGAALRNNAQVFRAPGQIIPHNVTIEPGHGAAMPCEYCSREHPPGKFESCAGCGAPPRSMPPLFVVHSSLGMR